MIQQSPLLQETLLTIDWLGELPAGWRKKRLKFLVRFVGGGTPSKANRDFWNGHIPWVSPKDMTVSKITETQDHITREAVIDSATRTVPPGAVLLVVRSGILRRTIPVAINSVEVALNQDMKAILTGQEVSAEYLAYVISGHSPEFLRQWRKTGATVESIEFDLLGNTLIPVPQHDFQDEIVRFLDKETARIDELVKKKQRLIELLEEKRSALISQAVTKGLNPDVPMKDSGVVWAGSCPSHWSVIKLSRATHSIQTGPFGSQLHAEEYIEGGIPVINPSNLHGGKLAAEPRCTVSKETFYRLMRHELQTGDLVFARRGEMGRCGVVTVDSEGWLCGTGSLRIRPNPERLNAVFGFYYLSLRGVREYLELESVGSTMDNVNTSIVGRIPVIQPPIEEQATIVHWIEAESQQINKVSRQVQAAINTLREYRTALISSAVTGKIDVRSYKPEPEKEVEEAPCP